MTRDWCGGGVTGSAENVVGRKGSGWGTVMGKVVRRGGKNEDEVRSRTCLFHSCNPSNFGLLNLHLSSDSSEPTLLAKLLPGVLRTLLRMEMRARTSSTATYGCNHTLWCSLKSLKELVMSNEFYNVAVGQISSLMILFCSLLDWETSGLGWVCETFLDKLIKQNSYINSYICHSVVRQLSTPKKRIVLYKRAYWYCWC